MRIFGVGALILLSVALSATAGESPWPMHVVDARFRGANALGAADVNGDGYADYVTNYEFDQRIEIALHPGSAVDPRFSWPTITAWAAEPDPMAGVNPEHACFGDLDGDGLLDIVVAQGYSGLFGFEGSAPGIRILWGVHTANRANSSSPEESAQGAFSWADGERIPATIDRGHFLYVQTHDVNADGALDIVAGGRVHGGNGTKAGLVWLEAPVNPSRRRDAEAWTLRVIDPAQWSGHGFVLEDMDRDGDADVVLANADWDTPEEAEEICWYANPTDPASASGSAETERSGTSPSPIGWRKHLIYQGSEFFAKPQLAVADLDGDGCVDLLTQVRDAIYWFRRTSTDPGVWEQVVIEKDPVARWLGRPIRVGDVNGDGRPDLVGMLIHENGVLPTDKAAAFWMEYTGDAPGAAGWATHVIKWGSGRTMNLPMFGEKWDQVSLVDVDGDGDLDFVANCEEWWEDGGLLAPFWDPGALPAIVAVVWFENRLNESPVVYAEHAGEVLIDAERPTRQLDGTWLTGSRHGGLDGTEYLQDHNTIDLAPRARDATRGVEYDVQLDGGTYAIGVRAYVPSTWGAFGLGGTSSNAAWLLIDDESIRIVQEDPSRFGDWMWIEIAEGVSLVEGIHTLALRVSEGGLAIDRIRLTRKDGRD